MIDNPSKKFRILELLLLHFFKQRKMVVFEMLWDNGSGNNKEWLDLC